MKKNMTKMLSFLISLLTLLGLFVGCGGKNNGNADTTASSGGIIDPGQSGEDDSDPYYDNYEKDDLPDNLDYNNREFTILCDASQYGKSFTDVYTGDIINSAVYDRSEAVQDRLNITFNIVREQGAFAGMADFTQKLVEAEDGYDLVLSYNLTPATMAIQGLLYNLKNTQYLNFEKPWWSSELLENVSVEGNVFFTADNSSWSNIRNMQGVFVDKQVFEDNHYDMSVDDLYDMVENNEWTMAKMFELVTDTYHDSDGLEGVTSGDTFGLSAGNSVWMESWFYAAGFTTMEQDINGEWAFSIGSESVTDFVDWFKSHFYGSDDCYRYDSTQYAMFKEKRVQFYVSALAMVEQNLEQKFAVLPMPMYNAETQDGYKTHFSNTYDMYCIPAQAKDPDMSSAVLECLASEAYRRIAPAYFENYLKVRNASDTRLQNMYDIIRAGIVFDMGVIFGELFVKDQNPIYFVRRSLNNAAGYENLKTTWTEDVKLQYLNLWQENLNKLTALS